MRIAFLYAALNNLDVLSCDVSNTFLEAPCGEKLWTVTGKYFSILAGTPLRINQSLYGIKYAGNYWHKALSTILSRNHFERSRSDQDICLRMSTNFRGDKYWE